MTAKRVDRGDDHRGNVRREGSGEDDLGEVRRY